MITVKEAITDIEIQQSLEIRKIVFELEFGMKNNEMIDAADKFKECHFCIAYYNGEPAGTGRWHEKENKFKFEYIGVKKELRNLGIGKSILKEMIKKTEGLMPIYLFAKTDMIKWFEKFGFEARGQHSQWQGNEIVNYMRLKNKN